jgi:sugar O-acyltransferase (sialic acid O-acetyltransferase NeuD family)
MTDTKPLIVIGGSGFGAKVAELARCTQRYNILGFLDDKPIASPDSVLGKHLGSLSDLKSISTCHPEALFFIALGDNHSRRKVAESVLQSIPLTRFPTIIHPSAIVLPSANIGFGCLLSYGSIVETSVSIGNFVIINTRVSISHHARVDSYSSLAPCAALAGASAVGSETAVGMGVMVHHGISIGSHTVVGSLSLVNKNLPDNVVAIGNPAKVIRQRSDADRYL